VRLGSVSRVHIHGQIVQLSQTVHALEQQDYQAAALNRLNGFGQDIRCQSLKVLQNTHAEGLTKNLVRLFVVGVSDIVERDEEFERIVFVDFSDTALDFLFDLLLALLSVTMEVCEPGTSNKKKKKKQHSRTW
jgi:hypothetical protein